MNDNNDVRDKREELEMLCYYKVLRLPWNNIMIFKSGLGFIVNVYYDSKTTIKKN